MASLSTHVNSFLLCIVLFIQLKMSSIARLKHKSRPVMFDLFLVSVMKAAIHESACAEDSMCWLRKFEIVTKRMAP